MTDRLTRITDPNDPRIADYVNIRERDLLRDQQTFICEGKTVLQVLVSQSSFAVKSLLILENRVDGCADIISQTPGDAPIFTADRAVMDAIAGFPMHRGVLAAAEKTAVAVDITGARRVVVASALANHDNVGALFRNAAAFGFDAVLLDAQCCDPLYRKSIRVSVGGVLRVPFWHGASLADLSETLKAQGFSICALATNGETEIAKWRPPEKAALLVGSEGEGLPAEVLDEFETLRIPMRGGFDSLNVATAAAIAMHHMVSR